MPAMSWSDFNGLPDVLGIDRFQILLQPSGVAGINQTLALRCTQIAVPEEMFEPMLVAIQGMEFTFRGKRSYDKMVAGSFVETSDQAVTTGITQWMQQIGGSESQNGARKADYACQGTLNVFDQSGNVAIAYLIDNMWPSSAPSMQLEGSASSPYMKQISFTYDRFTLIGANIT